MFPGALRFTCFPKGHNRPNRSARENLFNCLALNASRLDDQQSDASTVGRAVAGRCRDEKTKLADVVTPDANARTLAYADQLVVEKATEYVLILRAQRRSGSKG